MAEERQGGDLLTEYRIFKNGYIKTNRRKFLFILLFALLTPVCMILTLGFGVYDISVTDAVSKFFEHLTNMSGDYSLDKDNHYIWEVRLPRAIGALLVGLGLSVGGVVMQNNMRNPLAEPYTMGISSAAFLGATLSIVASISLIPGLSGDNATIVNAFLFALVPIAVILTLSTFRKLTPTAMILLGIAIMYVFSSFSQYLMVTSPAETMSDAYAWRVGTLAKLEMAMGGCYLTDYPDTMKLQILALVIIPISVILFLFSKKFDVMYAGDNASQTLGVNAQLVRIVSMALVSIMVAAIVSFTGTIGFIGLVGPHIARSFVGSNNRYLIPAAAFFGAIFILAADTVAKVTGANGLPVGVISSIVGGPLFILILIKQRKKVWC